MVEDSDASSVSSMNAANSDPKESGPKEPEQEEKEQDISKFDPKTSELDEPHKFAPKDLLSLLRNIETEMSSCEAIVNEENENRRR